MRGLKVWPPKRKSLRRSRAEFFAVPDGLGLGLPPMEYGCGALEIGTTADSSSARPLACATGPLGSCSTAQPSQP